MDLSDFSQIKALLSQHGFHFSKALGQNFLINPEVCPKMAQMCRGDNYNTGVIEIGPGIGVLTKELAKVFKKVVAIELDKRLLPILDKTLCEYDNVTVINADAMSLNLNALIQKHFEGMDVCVCANLPYYITSPVIMGLVEKNLPLKNITVMVQKEAAERLCACPGSRKCGAVSAAVTYFCRPEILFNVGRESFMPSPNVDSAVIKLTLRTSPPVNPKNTDFFFKCVKSAFAQRRKTILNSISATLKIDKNVLSDALVSNGISPSARAESLNMEELCVLSDTVYDIWLK